MARCGEGNKPIAVLLEQGTSLIATIFGIWKAGKIYVSLDPSFPHARNIYNLEDSQAGLIVTNDRNLSSSKELTQNIRQLINFDEIDPGLSTENLGLSLSADTLAYIFYTSGSTGQPKGVVQNHRNSLHNIMIRTNEFHVSMHDRLTLFASGTGQAIKNILVALANGAALYPLEVKAEEVSGLADWLIHEEITIYLSASPLFRHFVDTLSEENKFPKLRLIRLGSESVSRRDVALFKKLFSPNCLLVNGLSTTETGTIRKYFINNRTRITGSIVPVGYAVQDNEVLLLDEAGNEVEGNRIGEIAVKSRFLSPGYWRKQDLTDDAFVPDPEGGDERIYRTGDLGQMLPDDCLMHLGRKDFRVKIRGYSVELSEIDVALLDHPVIKEAVVVAQQEVSSSKQLVAYVVPAKRPVPNVSELRSFLKEKFPDYMIPSVFMMLDTLPLTPSGKVDRRALPAPGCGRPNLSNAFVPARTPLEEVLAGIWAEVLSLDQVGIHDNFFDLGGHSLAATRVVSRVIDRFKVDLPIKTLFDSPTVADMAMIITQNQVEKAGDERLARMLGELDAMSDEEVKRFLDNESKSNS